MILVVIFRQKLILYVPDFDFLFVRLLYDNCWEWCILKYLQKKISSQSRDPMLLAVGTRIVWQSLSRIGRGLHSVTQ